jgi:hypothetical protein
LNAKNFSEEAESKSDDKGKEAEKPKVKKRPKKERKESGACFICMKTCILNLPYIFSEVKTETKLKKPVFQKPNLTKKKKSKEEEKQSGEEESSEMKQKYFAPDKEDEDDDIVRETKEFLRETCESLGEYFSSQEFLAGRSPYLPVIYS